MLDSINLRQGLLFLALSFSLLFYSETTTAQEIVEAIHLDKNAGGLHVGEKVPNIVLQNRYNTTSNLYALGGKYVYLHYWASWCPCSQPHIPNYKVIYDKYQNANFVDANGFEIYSVSIDEKEMNWNEAVEDYNMVWLHNARIQDEQGTNQLTMWDLRTVPTSYLISPNGVVIAKNPSLIEMDAILSERSDQPGPRKLGRTVATNPNNTSAQNLNVSANTTPTNNQSWNNTPTNNSWGNTATINSQSWNNTSTNDSWRNTTPTNNQTAEFYSADIQKPDSFTTFNQTDYSNPNYANSINPQWNTTGNVVRNSSIIESTNVNELKVNIGDFFMLTQDHVDAVKDLGQLEVNNQTNGSQTVIVKGLPNHAAAYETLIEVHKRGFTDAYLTY